MTAMTHSNAMDIDFLEDVAMQDIDGGWSCPTCTLINSVRANTCAVCGWQNSSRSKALRLSPDGTNQPCQAVVRQIWNQNTLKTLLMLVGNAADNPNETKFRGPVRKSNSRIHTAIMEVEGAVDVLRQAGFEEDADVFFLRIPDVDRLCHMRDLLLEQDQLVAAAMQPEGAGYEIHAAADSSSPPRALIVPVKRVKPKFDEHILREIQAEARHRESLRGSVSESHPQAPLNSALQPPGNCVRSQRSASTFRLRLRLPLGGRMEIELAFESTVSDLLTIIFERTGIPLRHQKILYGYPLQALNATGDTSLINVGLHDGETIIIENLRDLFLVNVESGQFTMVELSNKLPPGDDVGEGSTGELFKQALANFDVLDSEKNFWGVVSWHLNRLVSGEVMNSEEVRQIRVGLLTIQQLFRNHDPQERLALALNSLPRACSHSCRIELHVDRDNFLSSVAPQILKLDRQQLFSPIVVKYLGENGQDAGGLTRDFFTSFATRLGDCEPMLWQLTGQGSLKPAAELVVKHCRHCSGLNPRALYRACGRVFGLAVLQGCKLGRQLAHSFVRLLVGDAPKDLDELQKELRLEAGGGKADYRGGRELLERSLNELGLSGVLTFTRSIDQHPQLKEVEVVKGGAKIYVTDDNKAEWLTAVLRHELVSSVATAASAFRDGLVDVFGGSGETCPLLCLLGPDDLIELWGKGGVQRQDVARWRAVSQVSPRIERQAVWFWQVLEDEFDDELRGKVLQFSTGTSSFGREGLPAFVIEPADGSDDRLPTAMTCVNMLQIPRYSCREVLASRLRTAAEMCSSFLMR